MQNNNTISHSQPEVTSSIETTTATEQIAVNDQQSSHTLQVSESTGFADLGLAQAILNNLKTLNYTQPTPIQVQSIPWLIEKRDLLGCAQTGTGKTAAFALPLIQQAIQAKAGPQPKTAVRLILTPTRELAVQIYDNIKLYGKDLSVRVGIAYGGVSMQPQIRQINAGLDILVATPGRLLDLVQQRYLKLTQIQVFVLDEADRMLDMGFIHDIKRITALIPKERQTLLFSATMPKEIEKLAQALLVNPVKVSVAPESTTAEKVDQFVYYVEQSEKKNLLLKVLRQPAAEKVIVFTRTKHGANRVAELLQKNRISSLAIHGNKSQNARQNAIDSFKDGKTRVLIATDIASRGIDVDDVTHVINFEVPNIAENYVHRIGRTARAGKTGVALSFSNLEEKSFIKDIEKAIRQAIPVVRDPDFHSDEIERAFVGSSGKAKAALEARENGGRGGRSGKPKFTGSKNSFLKKKKFKFGSKK